MKYIIYTDGTYEMREGKIAAGYVIRTKNKYIKLGGASLATGDIVIAEGLAVGLAVKYLLDKNILDKEKDKVEIVTDSLKTIETFNVIKKGLPIKVKDNRLKKVEIILKQLNETCPWSFAKIDSHHKDTNCNKLADRLAKYYLQFM